MYHFAWADQRAKQEYNWNVFQESYSFELFDLKFLVKGSVYL